MEYLFIILFIYASYLSIEKYVHTRQHFHMERQKGQEGTSDCTCRHPSGNCSVSGGNNRQKPIPNATFTDNR